MTDFEQYLVSNERPKLDKEQLQTMAKKAAAKYVNEKVPLNDTIKELSKESSLNDEQIRRVVEMTNTETFLHLFKQGYDKNVDFDVADASIVMSGTPVDTEKKAAPVFVPKDKYVPGQEYVSLDDAFQAEDQEKVASDEWSSEKTSRFLSVVDNVKRLASELDSYGNAFNLQVDKVKRAFYEAVNFEDASVVEAVSLVKQSGVNRDTLELIVDSIESFLHVNPPDSTSVASTAHPLYEEGFKLADVHGKFFGTLDMATSYVKETDISEFPGLGEVIKANLGKYIQVG